MTSFENIYTALSIRFCPLQIKCTTSRLECTYYILFPKQGTQFVFTLLNYYLSPSTDAFIIQFYSSSALSNQIPYPYIQMFLHMIMFGNEILGYQLGVKMKVLVSYLVDYFQYVKPQEVPKKPRAITFTKAGLQRKGPRNQFYCFSPLK